MNDLTIKELVKQAGEIAKAHGWNDKVLSPLEIASLFHTEVSEFVEDHRSLENWGSHGWRMEYIKEKKEYKPIGPLIELADLVIRVAHYCHVQQYDLSVALKEKMAYNNSRPYRHGNKKY